jgi:hypothetical protein
MLPLAQKTYIPHLKSNSNETHSEFHTLGEVKGLTALLKFNNTKNVDRHIKSTTGASLNAWKLGVHTFRQPSLP